MLFNNSLLLLFLKFYWSIVDLQCCVSGTQQSDSVICSLVAKSCPTLCDAVDYNLSGSSVHKISQARLLEQVTIFFCKDSSVIYVHFLFVFFRIFSHTGYHRLSGWVPKLYGSSFLVICLICSGVCVCVCMCVCARVLSAFSHVWFFATERVNS